MTSFLLITPFKGNILKMIAESDIFAKIILLILLIFSIISWGIIINKIRLFKKVNSDTKKFLSAFRKRKRLSDVYLVCSSFKRSPLSKILEQGYSELQNVLKIDEITNPKTKDIDFTLDQEKTDLINMVLERVGAEELQKLGRSVVFLATTGTVSPFLGLMGTIWGIIDSFSSIGIRGSASLAVVAPGIALALVATIVGLFVAIPAVIGYNHINNKLKAISVEVDNFSLEFLGVVKKELLYEKKSLRSTL